MRIVIASIFVLVLGCQSVKRDYECQKIFNNPQNYNINSFEELMYYNNPDSLELSLIVLDGYLVSREIVGSIIFSNPNNSLISVKSYQMPDGSQLDGGEKNILILYSNVCGKWKFKNGKLKMQ